MKRQAPRRLWSAVAGPALIALILTAHEAAAQNALGQGDALDANLRVGSGGRNPAARANDYGRFSDAIVTGRTGGLSRFRGNIDYGTQGQFSGDLGSDDLDPFRLHSMSPYSTTDALGRVQPSYISPQIDPAARVNTLRRAGQGVQASQVTGQRLTGTTTMRTTIDDQSIISVRGLGGAPLSIDRVRVLPSGDLERAWADSDAARYVTEPAPGRALDSTLAVPLSEGTPTPPTEPEPAPSPASERMRQPQRFDSRVITEPLQTRIDPRAGAADEPSDAQTPPGVAELLAGYESMLARIEMQARAAAPADASALDEHAERIRQALDRMERGLPVLESDGAGASGGTDAPAEPGERLVLESLSGAGISRVERTLAAAERDLAADRYFDALDRFRAAARMQPMHPMPQVGQLHASIGAGTYASAAQMLRPLFAAHPILTTLRYGPNALPTRARLDAVIGELRQRLNDDDARADAAMILAYLAYQDGRTDDLRERLADVMRFGRDRLFARQLHVRWLPGEVVPDGAALDGGSAPQTPAGPGADGRP